MIQVKTECYEVGHPISDKAIADMLNDGWQIAFEMVTKGDTHEDVPYLTIRWTKEVDGTPTPEPKPLPVVTEKPRKPNKDKEIFARVERNMVSPEDLDGETMTMTEIRWDGKRHNVTLHHDKGDQQAQWVVPFWPECASLLAFCEDKPISAKLQPGESWNGHMDVVVKYDQKHTFKITAIYSDVRDELVKLADYQRMVRGMTG